MTKIFGFSYSKVWQILKHFARSFHQAKTSYFWRMSTLVDLDYGIYILLKKVWFLWMIQNRTSNLLNLGLFTKTKLLTFFAAGKGRIGDDGKDHRCFEILLDFLSMGWVSLIWKKVDFMPQILYISYFLKTLLDSLFWTGKKC